MGNCMSQNSATIKTYEPLPAPPSEMGLSHARRDQHAGEMSFGMIADIAATETHDAAGYSQGGSTRDFGSGEMEALFRSHVESYPPATREGTPLSVSKFETYKSHDQSTEKAPSTQLSRVQRLNVRANHFLPIGTSSTRSHKFSNLDDGTTSCTYPVGPRIPSSPPTMRISVATNSDTPNVDSNANRRNHIERSKSGTIYVHEAGGD